MKLKMLETRLGSPDGRIVKLYEKDLEYEVPESLAGVFLDAGWGVKARGPAGENKNAGPSKENKTARRKQRKPSVKRGDKAHGDPA